MVNLSIITPTLNNVKFIEKCLTNVIHQDCPNLEHLIIDGGSNDGTLEVIKKYAKKYPHIRWLSEKDNGQSDAMNKGIDLSKGEIITFLNVDDYFEDKILSTIPQRFKNLPKYSIIVGNCNVRNGDKNDVIINTNKPFHYSFQNIFRYWRYDVFPGNPSAYFYTKTIHDKVGKYNLDDYYTLDYDFLYRVARISHIEYFDEVWGNFRYYKGTKTEENVSLGMNLIRRKNVAKRYLKYLTFANRLRFLKDEFIWKYQTKYRVK